MKRISILFLLALACSLVFAAGAFANFGPHGGYVDDTDSCAGCHRAHTSFSTVGWTDQLGTQHESALLVGSATTMTEFCNACHGDACSGCCDQRRQRRVRLRSHAGPAVAALPLAACQYTSASTFNGPPQRRRLLSDARPRLASLPQLKAATSAHNMEAAGPLWGAGSAVPTWPNLTCTDCHDPHGTSNYRLLKAEVNNATVGGYAADGETPNAFVYSYETGYPNPQTGTEGWLKHEAGAAQMAAYRSGLHRWHQDPAHRCNRREVDVRVVLLVPRELRDRRWQHRRKRWRPTARTTTTAALALRARERRGWREDPPPPPRGYHAWRWLGSRSCAPGAGPC